MNTDIIIGLIIGLLVERFLKVTVKFQEFMKKRKESKGAK